MAPVSRGRLSRINSWVRALERLDYPRARDWTSRFVDREAMARRPSPRSAAATPERRDTKWSVAPPGEPRTKPAVPSILAFAPRAADCSRSMTPRDEPEPDQLRRALW